jgi:opacity protein-like surface antigen
MLPGMRVLAAAVSGAALVLAATVAGAQTSRDSDTATILNSLGFSLQTGVPDKNSISFTKQGLLVPTPWGDFVATIVTTPVDRMVRVPLSPNAQSGDSGQPRLQPYVTAGSRVNVDSGAVLEQAKPSSFGDAGRTNFKAGAGVVLKLDDNVELFGEYQFMQLYRDTQNRGSFGPLGTSLDTSGFSLGLSVRY